MTQTTAVPVDLLLGHGFTGPPINVASMGGALPATYRSGWTVGYEELIRPLYYSARDSYSGFVYCYTASSQSSHAMEILPIQRHEGPAEAVTALASIERAFGDSASDLAKMLRVSRPMVYHYRQGMQPSAENFRRIRLIAELADYVATGAGVSLGPVLKSPQPEGGSLLALLSKEALDIPLIRRILLRTSGDIHKRQRLAANLGYATSHDRQDIMRARHLVGKPIYVSDPEVPGRIIQVRPDQSRVRGRMVNRVFVPDEE